MAIDADAWLQAGAPAISAKVGATDPDPGRTPVLQ
jgi:hypothetical protein